MILTVWGASYVWACVLALSAPGRPIQYSYQATAGTVTLWADSYAVDWDHGTAFLQHLKVFAPGGLQIAGAGRVDVSGIQLPNPNSVVANVRDVTGTIVRQPTGRFDLQDLLPPQQGPPSNIPFHVVVNQARVVIVDKAGKTPFRQRAIATDIDVRGMGESWIASGSVELPGAGNLRAEITSIPNKGYLVHGATAGLKLAALLDHFKTTPDARRVPPLKDFSASSLVAYGPVSLFLPVTTGSPAVSPATSSAAVSRAQPLQLQLRLKAIAEGVRYQDYAADRAYFNGSVSQAGARGELDATYAATKAKFNGAIDWRSGVTLGGALAVATPSSASMPPWLARMLPPQIRFADARMNGWLDYRKPEGVRLEGPISARTATVFGESVDQPRINLTYTSNLLRVGVLGGRWAGTPVQGAVEIGIRSPTMTGAITATNVDLATVGRHFGARGLQGKATASVLIGGTRSNPSLLLQASGNYTYPFTGKRLGGKFLASGSLASNMLRLDRLRVGTGAGSVRALGTISLKSRLLALDVDATNIQLEKLRSDLAGSINASGVLRGTLSDPRFRGQAVAVGLAASGQDIPFASADVQASRSRIVASNFHAVKGSGEAVGDLAVDLKTKALSGTLSAKNVLLNEYLGDQAIGVVTVPALTLGGTLDKPHAAGTAYGTDLLLGGIRVDRADIVSTLRGTVANVDRLTATIGDGTISGSGRYDYHTKTGVFNATAANLSLQRITPPGKGANVAGVLNGEAQAKISPSGIWTGSATGALKDVSLNGTLFGSGNWKLAYNGRQVSGSASVAQLDRFLLLENVAYDTKDRTIDAQVSVLNASVQDLYTSVVPFFPNLSYDVRSRLDTATGDVDATVAFSGPFANPDLSISYFQARNLTLQGMPLGTLDAVLSKTGTVWNTQSLKWNGPQGILVLNQGQIDTAGNLRVDADITNLDLTYVGLVDPNWAMLTGTATASILATGPSDAPRVHASFETTKDTAFTIGGTGESFSVNLDTIDVTPAQYNPDGTYTGGVSALGKFYYRGFGGDIEAHLPLNYPLEIPDGRPITASLNFPHVDLKDVEKYASFLDAARSVGSLTGSITISGPKSNLALGGAMRGDFYRLAMNGIQTTLMASVASVTLKDNKILMTFDSHGSDGGALNANLNATIPDLRRALDEVAKGETQQMLAEIPMDGSATATGFNVRQNSKNKEFGAYHATVNSKLDVSGKASSPLVAGRVGVTDTNVLVPSVFSGAGPGAEMLVDPRFDIDLALDQVARFRTSTADVSLIGNGKLSGSLSRPDFNATLTLEQGRINLPTARVTLDEGGTLRPTYSVGANGESLARVDVNLEGRTAVTAMRLDNVQRYDIHLYITGDLLSDNGLNLNATSDPPDLSKDEILALLGQTDVLKSIGSSSGLSQSETEARIRNALISVAVPTLTQGITNQLAQGLGLQYLGLEYNPLEGTSLSFAKVLGKGLILQGRRQISPPIGNRKVDYELKLTYRLPTRNAALSRVVFSAGLDQDRPWKLGVEYGFRF